jgi:uncharacterized membrane protein YphA (DoxX/SURF4 family)
VDLDDAVALRRTALERALCRVERIVALLHHLRWATLGVIGLRILIGFAFLPAGLKKILGQPFTDPSNHGRFHEFLHSFRDTGAFYQIVGGLQLVAACLLLTQRFAALGAFVALPLLTAIGAFCWSTAGVPTTMVVTLMWLGTIGLALWDLDRWRDLLRPGGVPPRVVQSAATISALPPGSALAASPVEWVLWERCGAAILGIYLGATLLAGEIYRPRGLELSSPAFYLLLALPAAPLVTWGLERRRRRVKP